MKQLAISCVFLCVLPASFAAESKTMAKEQVIYLAAFQAGKVCDHPTLSKCFHGGVGACNERASGFFLQCKNRLSSAAPETFNSAEASKKFANNLLDCFMDEVKKECKVK